MSIPSDCRRSDRAAGLRAVRLGALLLGAAAAALASGCRGRRQPDVLLITLDTTRADHLGCYGYKKPTTPVLDALAAESAVFTQVFATNPLTLPSHSSIMTGTYPLFHGVRDNGTYVLREDATTLAEVLQGRGYDTAAFIGSFVLDSRFGLPQGFALYDDKVGAEWSRDELEARTPAAFGFAERKANLVSVAATRWLRERRRRPSFAWLHYFDPHQPINPPEPHRSRFSDGYDAELAFVDEQIGQVFRALKEMGTYDDTLIVVTADHGEGLLEHGEWTHALLIFDSTMHVPLIVKPPGAKAPRRLDALASGVDVMPTILDILGITPPGDVQGRSLLPYVHGAKPDPGRAIYMESLVGRLACGWGELRALRQGKEKLIYGPRPRLYRVADDPGEVYDLAAKEPQTVARLKSEMENALRAWSRPAASAAAARMDPETVRRLASLGYVAGSLEASRGIRESLEDAAGRTDPYEKQSLFDLWARALDDINQGMTFEAIRRLETVLAGDPQNAAAMTTLATLYFVHARQPEKAVTLYEKSLTLNPYQEEAQYSMARIKLARGDTQGALGHVQTLLKFEPRSVRGLSVMALIAQAQGRLPDAQRYYELALEADPTNVTTLVALGAFHGRAGRHQEAGKYLKRAVDLEPDNPAPLYDTAVWYLQENDTAQAVTLLSRAVAAKPDDPDAHYVLGKVLYDRGERERARPVLERALALSGGAQRRAAIQGMLQSLSH